MSKIFFDLQRFKSISNSKSNTLISGTAEKDKIYNEGDYVTIQAGGGNDSVQNSGYGNTGWYVSIDAGAGNDNVFNYGSSPYVTINGGEGNDDIYHDGDNASINGGAGNDTLWIDGNNSTIYGGDGKDEISSDGNNATVEGGNGNDTLWIDGNNSTIYGGKDNDQVRLYSGTKNNLIVYNAGDGDDTIDSYNPTTTVSLVGDSVKSWEIKDNYYLVVKTNTGSITFSDVKTANINGKIINPTGTEGTIVEDEIVNFASNKTINTYGSKDTVSNGGSKVLINAGDGNDEINNYGNNSTIKGGAGEDRIKNYGDSVTVDGGADDDYIWSYGNRVSINGGAGNDDIDDVYGDTDLTILGGDGNDTIDAWSSDRSVIDGGKGNDKIYSSGEYSSVNGGDGDDSIHSFYGTIEGGKGNDALEGGFENVFKYVTGDGNDLVYDFEDEATLSISADNYSTTKIGNDIIVTVGDGKISLIGAASLDAVNIKGSFTGDANASKLRNLTDNADTLENCAEKSTINALGGDDSIDNWAARVSINGGTGNDSFDNYGESVTIVGGAGKDSVWNNTDASNTSLDGGAGEDYFNNDGSKVIINGGADNDTISNWGLNSTLLGGDGNDRINNNAQGYANNRSWYDNTLAIKYGGQNVLIDGGNGNDTISNTGEKVSITGGAGDDSIYSEANNVTLSGGKGTDILYNYYYDNILFNYAAGDGSDYVRGFNETSTLSISGGSYSTTKNGNNIIVTVGKEKITLEGAASLSAVNIKGASSGSDTILTVTNSTKSPVKADSTTKVIDASKRTKAVKIAGNALANSIVGGSKNDSLSGAAGADTLNGGKGNDTLTGGNGKDLFIYSAGNDIITDYAAEDKISIASATVSMIKKSGDNLIFTVGSGKITVKGAADKTITYSDKNGEHTYTYSNSSLTVKSDGVTLPSNYSDKTFDVANNAKVSDYAGTLKTIDASAVTKGIEIIGNAKANKILGGTKNDTIDGSSGNDTLTGGKGADTFIYYDGDGFDVITDYSSDDTIQIVSGTAKHSTKGKDVVFTVGKGKITVKNSLTKGITLIDEDDFEHDYFKGKEVVTKKNSTVTISDKYWKDTFDISNYGNNLKTINASAVTQNLLITGNGKANKILGGEGNDTIIGGKGGDTLYGGDGKDVFVYNKGDGKDIIVDYTAGDDIIKINSGSLSDDVVVKDNDVVFTIGEGKISVQNAADKSITIVDEYGKSSTKIYANNNADVAWFMEDDDNFSDNELSELVETKNYLPAQLDSDFDFVKENNFITYSDKK